MEEIIQPNSWSRDALLAKAQVYASKMDTTMADDWEFGFWSALSLELLARAALADVSPVLLAHPKSWQNLLHSIGKLPTARKFSPASIETREVLARLSELLPDFTQEVAGFCSKHVERRNAELHSGEMVFVELGTSEWLPRYYQACRILLGSMSRDLADFVADAERAQEMIESLEDAASKAVDQDIKAHTRVWLSKSEEERREAIIQATAWATRHSGHRIKCPSCDSPALLQGSPSGPVSTTVNDDVVIQRQFVLPSSFECVACRLKVSGYSKLSACGLGDAFSATTTYTAAKFFDLYNEDDLEEARRESGDYEPDFNDY
jgi:hypothetical protein